MSKLGLATKNIVTALGTHIVLAVTLVLFLFLSSTQLLPIKSQFQRNCYCYYLFYCNVNFIYNGCPFLDK